MAAPSIQNPSLPSWIFDIDDEDEISMDTPLLQELDIDINHIYRYTFLLVQNSNPLLFFYLIQYMQERYVEPLWTMDIYIWPCY